MNRTIMFSLLKRLPLLISASILWAADEAPGWLKDLASAPTPAYGPKVPAVVLLNEERMSVDDAGKLVIVTRYAVKVLTNEGRREARASRIYTADTGKIRDFKAWTIAPSGKVRKYGKEEILDVSPASNDIYNDVRMRVVSGASEGDVGSVFGAEISLEDKSIFTQTGWPFQFHLPVLSSRFALTVPGGWPVESVTFNHDSIKPQVTGTTYSWELSKLPFIEAEEDSPNAGSPRIEIGWFPPATSKAAGPSFRTWPEVSKWLSSLDDPQATTNDAMKTKSLELTANAKTEIEKLTAIGAFAQSTQYVAIQTGLGRGGGYKPHPATQVFQKMYGDCKDKANLMRAMLKLIGIDAYPVSIFSGDRLYVKEQWPSPHQFNHAIIAIKVSDAVNTPAVLTHPKLGRLLLFDPTDPYTPLGHLPEHEQDSLALVEAGDDGALVRVPMPSPDPAQLSRRIEAKLAADGSLEVNLKEHRMGQPAARATAAVRRLSKENYKKSIERWITSSAPSAALGKLDYKTEKNEFDLEAEFKAYRFGQIPNGKMIIFRPAIMRLVGIPRFTEAKRQQPVVLESYAFTDSVIVSLPVSVKVDELPDAIKLNTPFGKFEAKWELKDGAVFFERKLEAKAMVVQPEDFAKLKNFWDIVHGSSEAPAVLIVK